MKQLTSGSTEPRAGISGAPAEESAPRTEQSHEIELKLAGKAGDLRKLWKSAVAPDVKPASRHLVSTYYDTSDFRLLRRGFVLRVRQVGDKFDQTVKADISSVRSVMRRSEWSTPLDGPNPDLRKLTDPEVLEAIGLIVPAELRAVFATDVTRQTKTYRAGGSGAEAARIEAALDIGEIRCDGKTEPISEIELELLEGSSVALQREAARLHARSPMQFQPRSKAERGFALARDTHPTGVKANLPKLTADLSVEQGLERVLANCMSHWLANHAAVLDGRDTEGVHQMRVALRRLRSAFTIFRSVLPADDLEWLQGGAKSLIRDLGSARDWDVFIDELLQPVMEGRPDDEELMLLRQAVAEERRTAYEHAWATLRGPDYLKYVLELGAWLEGRGWQRKETAAALEDNLIGLADALLHKRHKKVLKLGRDFETLDDEALHRVRISLKKLRYATEFFAALHSNARTKPYIKSMRQLQDDLGHLNDVAVAEARLRDLCDRSTQADSRALEAASGEVIGWYSHALALVRPRIVEDWHAFSAARPFWKQ